MNGTPFDDRWEVWDRKAVDRKTTYPIRYWAKAVADRQVEVRKVEFNGEGEPVRPEQLMSGPRFPLSGFLKFYELDREVLEEH